ncbi:P- K Mg Cd Cu Zn Na Ca Na H-transporter [Brachionus plicatilis]|uniref:p-K Mg Cd Cu Zn Na Ca Na H-transporter n=1 Tax=Brachionus plicatilis TaxID=10195 RepID=A0A3M7R397_BRAPC|nr:P- K Mg Cd Cu Zn Na Ca Na H-transporter [Brachionus plicatilis]
MGKIAKLTNLNVQKETSLQKELKRFVYIVATAACIAATAVVLSWYFWLNKKHPNYINLPNLMVNTISVMIAFIPEGLPVCVTLSLLMIAKRMAKSRVLVKNLATIETLSCVNVIASDKTGTLTQNRMFVGNALAGLENLNLNFIREGLAPLQLMAASFLCNDAHFDENDKNTSTELRSAVGDATDIALLKFSHKYNDIHKVQQSYSCLSEIPFNSKNKWMMKSVKANDKEIHASIFTDKTPCDLMFIKGAPDILLKKCKTILQNDGSEMELSDDVLDQLCKIQHEWCLMGQRVIVICKRNCESDLNEWIVKPPEEQENYINEHCNDFCMIGMLGIIDPPREGITDVITKCREAGIRVSMVTGDFAVTAAAIAHQVGIFSRQIYDTILNIKDKVQVAKKEIEPIETEPSTEKYTSLLLNGSDIERMTDEDWRIVTQYDEIVFARTTPEQKLKIVKEFQKDKYVVGVTGDGVNDAPALKSADIGIAMGGGSQVAMEASELVLLDNNFSSILIAIRNGRLVFYNLKKVILYLLPGGCVAELVPVLLSIFLGVPQTLSSFQMLIISLFTDIAPSLSLMMEREETDLLKQPPRSRKAHLVDWKFILHAYFFLGLIISFFSQCMFFLFMFIHQDLTPQELIFDFGKQKNGLNLWDRIEFQDIIYVGQSVTFTDSFRSRVLYIVLSNSSLNVYVCLTKFLINFKQHPEGHLWFCSKFL